MRRLAVALLLSVVTLSFPAYGSGPVPRSTQPLARIVRQDTLSLDASVPTDALGPKPSPDSSKLLLPTEDASDPATYVSIGVNTFTVSGQTASGTTLVLELKDGTGGLKAQGLTVSSTNGYFKASLTPIRSDGEPILGGDTLEVTRQGGDTTAIYAEPITLAINKAMDSVSGAAPPGSTLQVAIERASDPEVQAVLEVQSDDEGHYEASFSNVFDIRGSDLATVTYSNPAGHQIYVGQYAGPFLRLVQYLSYLEGYVTPRTRVDVLVRGAAGEVKAEGVPYEGGATIVSDYAGRFRARFRSENYPYGYAAAGDTIEATPEGQSTIVFPVEPFTVQVDKDNNSVSGSGPPGHDMRVDIKPTWVRGSFSRNGVVTAGGEYSVSFSGVVEIKGGDYVYVSCISADDNEVVTSRMVFPYLYLSHTPLSNRVEALTDVSGQRSFVLRDSHGVVKATSSTGEFVDVNGNPIPTQPGDVVEATVGDLSTALVVPSLTMVVDRERDTISGIAPPNTPVQVNLFRQGLSAVNTGGNYGRKVVANEFGQYTADFGGEVDIRRGDRVFLNWSDAERNNVSLSQWIPVVIVQKDSQGVTGVTYPGVTAFVTVRGPDGVVRSQEEERELRGLSFHDYQVSLPLFIRGGDSVEVAAEGSEAMAVYVEPITIAVDKFQDVVSGTGPPNSSLFLRLHPDDGSYRRYQWLATTDTQGGFAVDLSSFFDLRGSERLELSYLTPDEHEIYLWYYVPVVRAYVNDRKIEGFLEDTETRGLPVTVTLLGRDGSVEAVSNQSPTWGAFGVSLPVPVVGGDTIRIAVEGKPPLSVYVEPLTAGSKAETDTIAGIGPPNEVLTVSYSLYAEGQRELQVVADSNGRYIADFAGMADIRRYGQGYVRYDTSQGNEIYASFTVPYLDPRLGSPLVLGTVTPLRGVAVTLRGPSGEVKATGSDMGLRNSAYYEGFWPGKVSIPLQDHVGSLVPVRGGDTLEVTVDYDEPFIIPVQPITVTANTQADLLSVTGPANLGLSLEVSSKKGTYPQLTRDITIEQSGSYTLDLRGIADLEKGDRVSVSYNGSETHRLLLERYLGLGEVAGLVQLQGRTGNIQFSAISPGYELTPGTNDGHYYSRILEPGDQPLVVGSPGYLSATRSHVEVIEGGADSPAGGHAAGRGR